MCSSDLKKKKRKSVKKKKIKRVLIKFWEVKCKEWILLWRRRVKKKCWMEIPKRVDILKNLENTSYYLPSPIFYFIPFAFTLHYILIKSLFDLEDCVVQILIWLNKKVWYKFFLASFHETICSFLVKHFSCNLYVRYLILFNLFRSHILLRVLHPISEWFHLLSDNTGKNWVEAYFQIEIRSEEHTSELQSP